MKHLLRKPAFWFVAIAVIAVIAAVCLFTGPGATDESAVPAGLLGTEYEFDACLYMNPLSSHYPFKGTGQRYLITKDGGLTILDEESGEVVSSHGGDAYYREVTDQSWRKLFLFGEPYDISGFTTRMEYALASDHRIYVMDDEVWLGTLTEDMTLWSLFRIKPVTSIAIIGGADGPTSIFVSGENGSIAALQSERSAEYLAAFSEYPRGEEGFARAYEGDWDGDGKTDKAYLDERPAADGYTANEAVVVEFGNGERFAADSIALAEISGWGHSFLLEAADLTGDGQNELILLIDLGGAGGRGSYALYPYRHTDAGWTPMQTPATGLPLTLEFHDNTAFVLSGAYFEPVASGDMLRAHYAAVGAEAEWERLSGTQYRNEYAADAICDIALAESGGRTVIKSAQYVTGPTGVHADQLGYLVATYAWDKDGGYMVEDIRFVYMAG